MVQSNAKGACEVQGGRTPGQSRSFEAWATHRIGEVARVDEPETVLGHEFPTIAASIARKAAAAAADAADSAAASATAACATVACSIAIAASLSA